MGILDYIQERDIERGGGQPYLVTGGGHGAKLRRPCPHPGCGRFFDNGGLLRQHLASDHPLGLPLLTLRGLPVVRELVMRVPEEAEAWGVDQCERCEVADAGQAPRSVAVSHLPRLLAKQRRGRLLITLIHRRATDDAEVRSEYAIDFNVLAATELEAIDRSFLTTISPTAITVESAAIFLRQCPHQDGPSREYAGALANYLIGCAIKEGRRDGDHRLEFAHFKAKFSEALHVLSPMPSPLAQAVAGVVRFNLNEFEAAVELAHWMPGLAAAGRFFLAPRAFIQPGEAPQGSFSYGGGGIPVDHMTEQIARLAVAVCDPGYAIEALESALRKLSRYQPLAETDRQKLEVVRAILLLRQGANDDLKLVIGKLRGDPAFGRLAQELSIK